MDEYIFNLLKTDVPGTFHFSFICSKPLCGYEYHADIETEGQLGVCKAYIAAHGVSHLRPL